MSRLFEETNRPSPNRLYRNPRRGIVRGVCAGLADYFGVRTWVIRLGMVIGLFLFPVPVVIAYLIAGFVLDPAPDGLYETHADERFWRGVRTDPKRTFEELRLRYRDLEKRMQGLEGHVTSSGYKLKREIDGLR